MFCPKCGASNPDNGRFCRSCGSELHNIAIPQMAAAAPGPLLGPSGKPLHLEGAMTKIFTGIAFLIVAIVLGYTGVAGGRDWWFWMLIPAFASMGTGIAQYMRIRGHEAARPAIADPNQHSMNAAGANALPPLETEYISPDSSFRTGDLVPPSVTDNTTRQLEIDSEGKTMTLPEN